MKIAFLTVEYLVPGRLDGGLANYLRRTGQALAARGHAVTIFTLSDRRARWRDGEVSIEEVPEPRLSRASRIGHRVGRLSPALAPALSELLGARALARALRRRRPERCFDIVQVSSYGAPGIALLEDDEIPVVCRLSSWSPQYRDAFGLRPTEAERWTDWFELRQVQEADAVVSPSVRMAQRVAELTGVEPEVVRSPIEPANDSIAAAADPPVSAEGGGHLLYFGTLSRTKGVDLIGDVVPALARRWPRLRFVFAGRDDGLPGGEPLADSLRARCGEWARALEFRGVLPKDELQRLIRGAIGVLMPSRIDNYPNACLEAQALGQLVVGARGSSLEEMIVDGETGFLVESGDAEALREGIERLLLTSVAERNRMVANVHEESKRRVGEDPIGRIVELYERTVTSHARRRARASGRSRAGLRLDPALDPSRLDSRSRAAPSPHGVGTGVLGTAPLLSLCICTFNRARRLASALDAVCARPFDRALAELVVVDNGSTDETREVVERAAARHGGIRYLREPIAGLSRARNRAWREARGRFVGYIDDDTLAREDWLAIARELAAGPAPAVFGGPFLPWFDSPRPAWMKEEYCGWIQGDRPRALGHDEFLGGGFLFFRRERLEALGGFDARWGMRGEAIGYGEETDLIRRLRCAFPDDIVFYEPRLALRHLVARYKMSWRWILKSAFVDGRHHYHVFERWREPEWRRRTLRALRLLLVETIASLVRRDRAVFPHWRQFVFERSLEHVKLLGAGFEHFFGGPAAKRR